VTYLFVPVNVILFVPYLASKYNKVKQKQIKKDVLKKNVVIIGVLLVLVLLVEYRYFSKIQKNIISMKEEKNNTYQNETIEQNEENT